MFRSFRTPKSRLSTARSYRPWIVPLEDRQLLSFAPAVPYSTGVNPVAVAVGDFTGTGNLDLVTANQFSNSMSVVLGNGDGTFQSPMTYPTGMAPDAVVVGDFNGDGNLDIAIGNFGTDPVNAGVSIFLGNGDGTFQKPLTYTGFHSFVGAVAVGDFNGDGNLDLAVANNGVTILLGNGDGTFQPTKTTYGSGFGVAAGDLNNDGNLDLVTNTLGTNSVGILLGNGDGTFQLANTYTFARPALSPVLADFNGDGNLDVAVVTGSPNNQVGVFLGNGDGSFQSPSTFATGNTPQHLAAADFDGDGNPDLAVVNSGDNSVGVQLGQGDGTFASGGTFGTGGQAPVGVAVGDFNGDGFPDLVVTNSSLNGSTVGVLLNAADWHTRPGAAAPGGRGGHNLQPLGTALTSATRIPELAVQTQPSAVSAQGEQVAHSATDTSDLAFVTASDHRQAPASVLHRAYLLQPDEVANSLAWDDRLVGQVPITE